MSTTAQSNDNLVGVYTMNTNNTEGAITGLREADKTVDDVKIVGYDTSEPILQALEDGQITGLVVQYPYGAGRLGVDSAVALANGLAGAAQPGDAVRVRHARRTSTRPRCSSSSTSSTATDGRGSRTAPLGVLDSAVDDHER